MITIDTIRENGWLIFEVITGSKAYGLATAISDTDIRGVFVLPKDFYYSLDYIPQISNESNDIVYYELKRFIELLVKNNPNILELLDVPESCVLYRDEIMDLVTPGLFLSKLCEKTFANYAYTQIKKAYGLEKKIVNPMEEARKSVLDFCFVYVGKEAVPVQEFLTDNGFEQGKIGLTAVTHIRDCYNLYYSNVHSYSGIIRKEDANDVCLSSIPKGEIPAGLLYFNKDAYSVYCKRYKEYWEWVDKRNEERYNTTMSHGKNYDSKNMMHVFRLLLMAREIAVEGRLKVQREDRDFLLAVKNGKYEYDELVARAEALKNELPFLYEHSNLQEEPDMKKANSLLLEMRENYYKQKDDAQRTEP